MKKKICRKCQSITCARQPWKQRASLDLVYLKTQAFEHVWTRRHIPKESRAMGSTPWQGDTTTTNTSALFRCSSCRWRSVHQSRHAFFPYKNIQERADSLQEKENHRQARGELDKRPGQGFFFMFTENPLNLSIQHTQVSFCVQCPEKKEWSWPIC